MDINSILKTSKIIAIVGLSDKPDRPSYDVASYLLSHGYTIIPVNPMIKEWKGIKAYSSLLEIPKEIKVDVVDVFRKSEDVLPIAKEAVSIGAKTLWLQLGIINEEASLLASKNHLNFVNDRCIKIEHSKII